MENLMRNKLDFSMYCSVHPNEKLTFDSSLSKVGASSAFELNIKIVVSPCSLCKKEHEKVTDAIEVLFKANNKKV